MTGRRLLLASIAVVAVAGCGSSTSTATTHDLGSSPDTNHSLGGTANSTDLQAFSTFVTVSQADQVTVSTTVIFTGSGTDELVDITTPYGGSPVHRTLSHEQAQPLSIPLPGGGAPPRVGSQVTVTVTTAHHGTLRIVAPVVRVHAPAT